METYERIDDDFLIDDEPIPAPEPPVPDMMGEVFAKPVTDRARFDLAMRYVADPANKARMLEYLDRFEVSTKEKEEPRLRKTAQADQEPEEEEPQARIEALERRVENLEAAMEETLQNVVALTRAMTGDAEADTGDAR